MRTDPSKPSPSLSNRLRSRAVESVSRFRGVPPLGRLAMLALLATAAALIGYGILSLSTAENSAGRAWLFAGNRYSQDDVAKITKVLEDAQLDPITDGGRIGVPRARLAEAQSMLGKAGLAPRRMTDIRDDSESFASVLRPPSAQEKYRDEQQAARLTLAIDRLDPELGASVQINRKRSVGLRPSELVEVHVYLDVESGQKITSRQVEAIKNLMISLEPDLKPEGLHLVDRMGNVYLSPTNPSLGHRSRAKAREEELADKIATTLSWIRDLRVTVTINPEPLPPAPPADAQVVETIPQPIEANQPLEAEPSETPEPVAALPAVNAVDEEDTRLGQATVFIQVPVSYVIQKFAAIHGGSRRPDREDLGPIFRQTREDVIARVRNIVPESELAHVEVDKFDTDTPPAADAPAIPSRLTLRSWWVPAALGGAVAALALAAFGGWWAARRPVNRPRPSPSQRPARWTVATPSSPSERVRELIRIDPAAAAGVLHRWIGQSAGGPDA